MGGPRKLETGYLKPESGADWGSHREARHIKIRRVINDVGKNPEGASVSDGIYTDADTDAHETPANRALRQCVIISIKNNIYIEGVKTGVNPRIYRVNSTPRDFFNGSGN